MILGYSLALIMGLSLGLMGGGGSILTVPILVYAIGMSPKSSIALSLAIVGLTSIIGVFGHFKNKNINLKMAALFAPFAMLGTFFGAKLSKFFTGEAQLLLFGTIMLVASILMIKKIPLKEQSEKKQSILFIAVGALIVGIITGLVGIGGGFLIVPALVLIIGLPMKEAIGTSLLIIALNSASGFLGYLGMVEIDWSFLLIFTLFSGIGILLGSHFVKYISQAKLKKMFGIFLIFMAIFILYKNKNVLLGNIPTSPTTTIISHLESR